MLSVIPPLSFIHMTILMPISTLAISPVIDPFALIDATIGMDEPANAIDEASLPLALHQGAVEPHLAALATSVIQILSPFTFV